MVYNLFIYLTEVAMKKSFLFLLLTGFVLTCISAKAELTNGDVVSPDYLKIHGHSDAMIEATQKIKARSNGEEYTSNKETNALYEETPIKYIRKFFMYLDPAYDDDSFMNHDISPTTKYTDL